MTGGDEIFVSLDMKAVISKVKACLSISERYLKTLWVARAIVKFGPAQQELNLLPVLSIVHQMIDYSRILQR